MKLLSIAALLVGSASAFAPSRRNTVPSIGSSNSKGVVSSSTFQLQVSSSPPPPTETKYSFEKTRIPEMMDADIFNFNKILIDTVYNIICFLYPVTGGKRDFARFYVLETVARVPYFAYLSVMHLRETFGERGSIGEQMRTHYAEADNELHHLLIMESLGGNENAVDRFLAQTMAFFYYWYVVIVYFISPPVGK
jgi:hypothetical protein